eukprot:scaffold171354_cov77-Attheya_sp.AAC.1
MVPVQWKGRKQAKQWKAQSLALGLSVAMKVRIETVRGFRYNKLWMMGVPTSADLCAKVLSGGHGGQKRDGIVDLEMWYMGFAGFEVALLVEIPVKSAGGNAEAVKLAFLGG